MKRSERPLVSEADRAAMARQAAALREIDEGGRGELDPTLRRTLIRLVNPNRVTYGLEPFDPSAEPAPETEGAGE